MRSRDPTKTTGLRRSFAYAARQRIDRWSALLRTYVVSQRGLDVGTGYVDAATLVRGFNELAYRTGYSTVVGDGEWCAQYVERAYVSGRTQMAALLKRTPPIDGRRYRAVETELALVRAEVEGVVDATLQQLARIATDAVRRNSKPARVWREMLRIIGRIAVTRLKAVTNVTVVKMNHLGRMDEGRRWRLVSYGVEVETNPPAVTRDSCGCASLVQKYRDAKRRRGSSGRQGKSRRQKPKLVEFVTAGDELVCQECEDLEGSVFTYTEAIGIIPVHPSCRCAVVPHDPGSASEDPDDDD